MIEAKRRGFAARVNKQNVERKQTEKRKENRETAERKGDWIACSSTGAGNALCSSALQPDSLGFKWGFMPNLLLNRVQCAFALSAGNVPCE